MKFLILLLSVFFYFDTWAAYCPYSASSYDLQIQEKTKKTGENYLYEYSLTNQPNSQTSFSAFRIYTNAVSIEKHTPPGWRDVPERSGILKSWSYQGKGHKIHPGVTVTGFSLLSKGRPGLVKAVHLGNNSITDVVYTKIKAGPEVSCPGFWEYGSRGVEKPNPVSLTIGPITDNQVGPTALFRLNTTEAWTGSVSTSHDALQPVDPLKKGPIEILVLGDSSFHPEEAQIGSIKFGRGEATPKNTKIVDVNLTSPPYTGKALLLTFDLEKVQVLCDLDRALFLTGKTEKGRDIFTGVQIKPTFCDEKQWATEAPGILKYRKESPVD